MTKTRVSLIAAGLFVSASLGGASLVAAGEGITRLAGPCDRTASRNVPQPTAAQLAAAGLGKLAVASGDRRVDLVAPPFSRPTRVTNPLFPIAGLRSAVLNGQVDGKPFRTETTLLPQTRILEWTHGQCIEVLVSQYLAFSGHRIHEVALDLYAQDDRGSVWYLGENVFNYENGIIAETAGTWFAGEDGPAAMIMPSRPKAGDVYRPENIAGLVFEEVTVKAVDRTVAGPRGPVRGAVVVEELHDDGSRERKVFAPGYGEFSTGSGGDVEALAVAVPTDARSGGRPASLARFAAGADRAYGSALAGNWSVAAAAARDATDAWRAHRSGSVPPRLVRPAEDALASLVRAVEGRQTIEAARAALRTTQAALDLQLQYRSVASIDRARFELWLRQVIVDARARSADAVIGDIATLEWIRDRVAPGLARVDVTRIDTLLRRLRRDAEANPRAAETTALALRRMVARLR